MSAGSGKGQILEPHFDQPGQIKDDPAFQFKTKTVFLWHLGPILN
jgi:hypothetical protein